MVVSTLTRHLTTSGLERHGNISVITLRKGPENRVASAFSQEIIYVFHYVQRGLRGEFEGAVIRSI